MITGIVNADYEAVILLRVHGPTGHEHEVDAIIDTGFNGFLTLPLEQITRLGFPYEGNLEAVLGDGRDTTMDMFLGTVLWEGYLREGTVLAAEGTPLVGMALLRGSRVTLEVQDGGRVTIEPLP